ncbi:MAG: TnpV protein [Blautia glucerasea]|nr:TnpV protein [Blautia glucerasea]
MYKTFRFDAENSLWYEQCGEYRLPCLTVPNSKPIGIGGQCHRRYLRQHKYGTYTALLLTGRLDNYLADIDRQAEEMFLRLVMQIAEAEGVTEQLKAGNQMEWISRMNNIRNRAMEIVNSELIYRV